MGDDTEDKTMILQEGPSSSPSASPPNEPAPEDDDKTQIATVFPPGFLSSSGPASVTYDDGISAGGSPSPFDPQATLKLEEEALLNPVLGAFDPQATLKLDTDALEQSPNIPSPPLPNAPASSLSGPRQLAALPERTDPGHRPPLLTPSNLGSLTGPAAALAAAAHSGNKVGQADSEQAVSDAEPPILPPNEVPANEVPPGEEPPHEGPPHEETQPTGPNLGIVPPPLAPPPTPPVRLTSTPLEKNAPLLGGLPAVDVGAQVGLQKQQQARWMMWALVALILAALTGTAAMIGWVVTKKSIASEAEPGASVSRTTSEPDSPAPSAPTNPQGSNLARERHSKQHSRHKPNGRLAQRDATKPKSLQRRARVSFPDVTFRVQDTSGSHFSGLADTMRTTVLRGLKPALGAHLKRHKIEAGYRARFWVKKIQTKREGGTTGVITDCALTLSQMPGNALRTSFRAKTAASADGVVDPRAQLGLAKDAVTACGQSLTNDMITSLGNR